METEIMCKDLKNFFFAKSSGPDYFCSLKGVNGV